MTHPELTSRRLRMAATLLLFAAACNAQIPQPPLSASPTDKLVWEWNEMARKINALASEFPEDKYDQIPTPGVRSFAQQLLHVAFWNQVVEKSAKGQKVDRSLNELPRSEYKTKADVVRVVRDSFVRVAETLGERPQADVLQHLNLWTTFLEHNGEHYGQLVFYYRLGSLIPPESRPR